MEINTETDVSHCDLMGYFPLNKTRMEMLRMEGWLRADGHNILEYYTYEKHATNDTVIGIKSEACRM